MIWCDTPKVKTVGEYIIQLRTPRLLNFLFHLFEMCDTILNKIFKLMPLSAFGSYYHDLEDLLYCIIISSSTATPPVGVTNLMFFEKLVIIR